MRRRLTILLSIAVAAGVLWIPSPASACTVAESTEAEQLARADLVFEGIAASSHDPNAAAPISSGDPIYWTFIVDHRIKGDAAAEQTVWTPRSGATCGVDFTVGVRYRVFAAARDGAFMSTLGSGTREAVLVPETTTTTKPPAPTTSTPTTKAPGKRPLARTG